MKSAWLFASLLLVSHPLQSRASALNDAAATDDLAAIAAALDSGADVNQTAERTTPLCEAVAQKHLEAAQLLIQRGADVNRPGKFRRTPLQLAAMKNSPDIVKLLLDEGAEPDATTNGFPPLHAAADSGCLECVKYLIGAGVDVNVLTSNGTSAIHNAKINHHEDVVRYLREHGATKPKVPSIAALLKTAQPKAGEEFFAHTCHPCHLSMTTFTSGTIGPPLWDVLGRKKASVKGFKYSPAMKEEEGSWTYEALNTFLFSPSRTVPGTAMFFPGLPEEAMRANVIAYLRSQSDAPLPFPDQ